MANIKLQGSSAFRYMDLELAPGESIITEAGSMATMDPAVTMQTKFNGGFFGALIRKFLGGESLFINTFSNSTQQPRRMTLTAPTPGDVRAMPVTAEGLCLQPGAFIACTPGVKISVKYAGIVSFIAREGLFKLVAKGSGTVWFGGYGSILERSLDGEVIVDSGHLISYDPGIRLKLQLPSGIIGSFLSGEGVVTRLEGKGRYYIQTRSVTGLAAWANSKW
jgi:uncharacterized protein (TIGR00266 family)